MPGCQFEGLRRQLDGPFGILTPHQFGELDEQRRPVPIGDGLDLLLQVCYSLVGFVAWRCRHNDAAGDDN